MTLFLQYNVNNHIRDGARHLWWPSVLSVSESVCTEQGSTEFRTPLCEILATPLNVNVLYVTGSARINHVSAKLDSFIIFALS